MSRRAVKTGMVAGLLTVAATTLLARGPLQEHATQYAEADIAAGQRLYNLLCVNCHGATGSGVGNVDLRRGPLPRASTDPALMAVITNGIPASGMPPMKLQPAELTAVVAFIRAGFDRAVDGASTPGGNADRGRTYFEGDGKCLTCHRVGDKGDYSAPDLTEIGANRSAGALQRTLLDPTSSMRPINRSVRALMKDGTIVAGRRLNEDTYTVQLITEKGRLVSLVKAELREWTVSTVSPMPSYKDSLTPEGLADLVAYLLSLKGAER